MHQDEIPLRAPGHREASASITAAFATLPYPVSKEEAMRKVGEWKVPLGDEKIPLGRLLEGMPVEEFSDTTDAIRSIDQHWLRMTASLRGETIVGQPPE